MKYNFENVKFWNRLRAWAEDFGTDLSGLNAFLGIANGTLEIMEEYGIEPEGELLTRIRRLLGVSEREILSNSQKELPFQALRNVVVFRGGKLNEPYADVSNIAGTVSIDRPVWDDREYVGLTMKDDSMSEAFIHRGDILIIRRQAIAMDGSIVAAEVDGETVVRRFHRNRDVIWLEAEGYAGEGRTMVSDDLNAADRRIRIWGQVISASRIFDPNINISVEEAAKKPVY